jgi:hypothetical protein
MIEKIKELKNIISKDEKLNKFKVGINDELNKVKFRKLVTKIITKLPKINNKNSELNRELSLLLNEFNKNNTYGI